MATIIWFWVGLLILRVEWQITTIKMVVKWYWSHVQTMDIYITIFFNCYWTLKSSEATFLKYLFQNDFVKNINDCLDTISNFEYSLWPIWKCKTPVTLPGVSTALTRRFKKIQSAMRDLKDKFYIILVMEDITAFSLRRRRCYEPPTAFCRDSTDFWLEIACNLAALSLRSPPWQLRTIVVLSRSMRSHHDATPLLAIVLRSPRRSTIFRTPCERDNSMTKVLTFRLNKGMKCRQQNSTKCRHFEITKWQNSPTAATSCMINIRVHRNRLLYPMVFILLGHIWPISDVKRVLRVGWHNPG